MAEKDPKSERKRDEYQPYPGENPARAHEEKEGAADHSHLREQGRHINPRSHGGHHLLHGLLIRLWASNHIRTDWVIG